MPRTDFRKNYQRATELQPNTWYRSPLWADDHLLGESWPFIEDEISWCGRALGLAMQWGADASNEFGGLFVSERKSGKCSQCRTRQKEWEAQ